MDDEILKVRDMAATAQRLAETAVAGISSHEAVCAERYLNIKDRLQGIPRLFDMLEKNRDLNEANQEANKAEINKNIAALQKNVYLMMGAGLAALSIIEILRYLRP